MKNNKQISNNLFIPPKKIEINNISYSLKDKLANNKFSYRCISRKFCNSCIHINNLEIFNYNNNNLYNITINKTVKEHSQECEFSKSNLEKIDENNNKTIKNIDYLKKTTDENKKFLI